MAREWTPCYVHHRFISETFPANSIKICSIKIRLHTYTHVYMHHGSERKECVLEERGLLKEEGD